MCAEIFKKNLWKRATLHAVFVSFIMEKILVTFRDVFGPWVTSGAKTMIPAVPFIHRKNPDSTHDSICTSCFLTVARGQQEADLLEGEQSHDCERAILLECRPAELQQAGQ
jgi:hypothetical protein